MWRNVQLKTWAFQYEQKNVDKISFCQKVGRCDRKELQKITQVHLMILLKKKVMRVFKCDVTYIEEIKHFQDSKPFFIFIM